VMVPRRKLRPEWAMVYQDCAVGNGLLAGSPLQDLGVLWLPTFSVS
jgi:hypothetical protein